MQQFVITEKKLVRMLEAAFMAGYESPVEMMDQELVAIYNSVFDNAEKAGGLREVPVIPTQSQIKPQVMFDTDSLIQEALCQDINAEFDKNTPS